MKQLVIFHLALKIFRMIYDILHKLQNITQTRAKAVLILEVGYSGCHQNKVSIYSGYMKVVLFKRIASIRISAAENWPNRKNTSNG